MNYFGSGILKQQKYISEQIRWQNKEHSTMLNVPPLGGVVLKKKI
jgi:1,4-alpha-glucan branching enzyme